MRERQLQERKHVLQLEERENSLQEHERGKPTSTAITRFHNQLDSNNRFSTHEAQHFCSYIQLHPWCDTDIPQRLLYQSTLESGTRRRRTGASASARKAISQIFLSLRLYWMPRARVARSFGFSSDITPIETSTDCAACHTPSSPFVGLDLKHLRKCLPTPLA